MDRIEQARLYADAWETWGLQKQIDMLIEEMAELTQALLKARRQGAVFSNDVYEEMADVGICMGQVEMEIARLGFFHIVTTQEERKLLRLRDRLKQEGED